MTASTTSDGARRAKQYAADITSGKIIACEKVKLACSRFLNDLERQSDPDYPWRFDEGTGARPVRFMETCLRPTKGDYDRMTLMGWQCFIEANLYGWVSKADGLRRFREALILVGSGNGKSTLMAGNASYAVSKDGERGPEVYLLANSRDQAGIMFNECRNQILNSPILAPRFRTLRDGVYYAKTNGVIRSRSSDSKRLDGLNPHHGIFDEIHEYRNFALIDVIKKKMVKRRQPLLIYISTMGKVIDGPLVELYNLFSSVLNGTIDEQTGDRLFAFIAELDMGDPIDDVSLWIKANPGIGGTLVLNDLIEDWNRSKLIPQNRANFICKQLNVFVDSKDAAFMSKEVLDRNTATIEPDSLEGRRCYGGFDLSTREDFTAAALEFPLDDGRVYVLQHSWVPERKVREDHEKIDYYNLAMRGCLTIVPGEFIEQGLVYSWFLEQAKHYEILSIGYDPANALKLLQLLEAKGFNCKTVRQGPLTLNEPMKDAKELLLGGKVVSNNDPLFRWYLGNVKISTERRHTEKENWMPTKINAYRKIDGFMAWLFAHTINMNNNPVGVQPEEIAVRVYSLGDRRARGGTRA